LIRRIYNDEDVVRFARKLHPIGAFGFECTLDRVIEELKSYNDFSIHRVIFYSENAIFSFSIKIVSVAMRFQVYSTLLQNYVCGPLCLIIFLD